MALVCVPNGIHMPAWRPATEGTGFVLPSTLEPLQNVRDHVMVVTGLTQDKARPNGDGPGDHARSAASCLTGWQARKTSGANIMDGISADPLAAHKIAPQTPLP